MAMKNLLMFYAGDGHAGKERVGIIMEDHAQPIAFWPKSYGNEGDPNGVLALWENKCDVEDFFEALGIDQVPAPGLWVLELWPLDITEEADNEGDNWEHLADAFDIREALRRPTLEEVNRLVEGLPPWEGGEWA